MSTAVGLNWARNHAYRAAELRTPATVAELQHLVADSPQVRALGTRHSFSDVADTSGVLVSLIDLPPDVELAPDARSVTVPAGIRYGVLAAELHRLGFALHNLGSLPHISVAGAISTGTHGSGDTNGTLSSAVSGLSFISGRGELVTVDRSDPDFAGMVVGLGAFGVITRVTLDIEPTFDVRQTLYTDLPWPRLLDEFDAVTSSAYSVNLHTDFCGDTLRTAWLKTRMNGGEPSVMPSTFFGAAAAPLPGTVTPVEDAALSSTATPQGASAGASSGAPGAPAGASSGAPGASAGAPAGAEADVPADEPPEDTTTISEGTPGPWSERLAHFRLDATPSHGDELQSEYFVDRRDGPRALSALREIGERIAPHLHIAELRTVAADELWLSPTYRRDSLAIAFTWKNEPDAVLPLLPQVEAALAPFAPRPHWGKLFALPPAALTAAFERLPDFVALAERYDPAHQFRNDWLERNLGLLR